MAYLLPFIDNDVEGKYKIRLEDLTDEDVLKCCHMPRAQWRNGVVCWGRDWRGKHDHPMRCMLTQVKFKSSLP